MATTQIVPFAIGAGALVLDPVTYAALPAVANGFSVGIADEYQLNTVWRQSSFMAAALANFLVSQGVTQNDDGNLTNATANISQAIKTLVGSPNVFTGGTTTGSANAQVLATVVPATGFALSNGFTVIATAGFTNSGATTYNVAGTGAQAVKKLSGSTLIPLAGGEIVATQNFTVTWNSTAAVWVLQTTPPLGGLAYLNAGTAFTNDGAGNLVPNFDLAQCYLNFTSASTITLGQKSGNKVLFPNGSIATIPGAGIAAVNNNASINGTPAQVLSASTGYYVYLWYNGAAYVLDFSTVGWAVDANTGIACKSGDTTRVLVGFVYTTVAAGFASSPSQRQVISFHNRKALTVQGAPLSGQPTSSATFAELASTLRIVFCSWNDEAVTINAGAIASVSGAGNSAGLAVGIDNLTAQGITGQMYSATGGQSGGLTALFTGNVADGPHTAILLGNVNATTATFTSGALIGTIRG